jgi:hypothetical protein
MSWTFESATEAHNFGFGASGTTIVTDPYAAAVSSGALLLVEVMFTGAITCDSVTDSASNSYTRIESTQNRGDGQKISAWYAISNGATTPTVTFHFSGSAGSGSWQICSFTHPTAPITLQTSSVATGTGTTSSSAVTTSVSDELVIGFDLPSAYPTGASAGFTGTAAYSSTIPMVYAVEAVAGSYSPGTVTAGSAAWAAISAAFKGPVYSISGAVSGDIADGVLMTLSGDASATTTTAGGGLYNFPDLVNGNYVVTPTLDDFTFTPTFLNETISNASITGANFTAVEDVFLISGNTGTASVVVALTGDATGSTTSNGSGNYSFSGLVEGNYTLTPSKVGFIFSPTFLNETIVESNVTGVDFTAIPVYILSGNAGVGSATLNLTGDATASTVASGAGDYFFSVPDGTYVITPSLTGYEFVPTSL